MSDLQRIKPIFEQALDREGEDRRAFLDQVCGQEPELRRKVDALLQANESARGFLEFPVFGPEPILDEPPVAEGPGTVIGRYKLLERIGEGGMAVVYMAEQAEPIRRKVALKIIKPGMDTKQVIARFEAERQVLAMMDHPNIAKVFDAGATETGRPYFVMELVTGVSITDYCDANRLGTRERLALFVQACHAVQHAHQKGIIHRDIKPSNVMVTMHDGKPVPKVIDFGIAKATNQRLTEKTLFTRYAQIIGTPAYMSPEQAELSDLDIDTRSDIYSLGVLLYELLAGTTPFSERQLREAGYAEMQRVIREEEPTKPSTKLSTLGDSVTDIAKRRSCSADLLRKTLRGDLDWIVMKTLEKDRTRRYETATDLLGDVERHLHHEPVSAGPPSAWYQTKKFVRRHCTLMITTIVVMTAVLVGLVVSAVSYVKAEQAREKEAAARAEAQAVTSFLTEDLLASVYPEKARGQEVTVRYLLEAASLGLEDRFVSNPVAEATVRMTLGLTYQKMGDYSAAEPHLERALRIRREHLGEDAPATLQSMCDLAWQYVYQGRIDEAKGEALRALEIGRKALGHEHPVVLSAMQCCGFMYVIGFQKEKADPLVREGYATSLRLLGEEHEQTVGFMNLLAWLYDVQQRQAEAMEMAVRTLHIAQSALGRDHPYTIQAMNKLGRAYTIEGRFEEAEVLLRESIELGRQVLGERHLFTVWYMGRLASLYRMRGDHQDEEDTTAKALEIARAIPGKLMVTGYLRFRLWQRVVALSVDAREHYDAGRYEDAANVLVRQERLRQLLDYGQTELPPPDVAVLAMSLHRLGRYDEAQNTLQRLREMLDAVEYTYEEQNLYEAEELFAGQQDEVAGAWRLLSEERLEAVSEYLRSPRPPAPGNALATIVDAENLRRALARAYCIRGCRAEGLGAYQEAIGDYETAIRANPDCARVHNRLARLFAVCHLAEWRDGTRSIEHATKACELAGWANPSFVSTLAAAHAESGDFAEAVQLQQQATDLLGEDEREQWLPDHEMRLHLYEAGQPYRWALVGCWTFDQSSSEIVLDSSGNDRHGQTVGDAHITDDADRPGQVLCLDGDGDWVDCGNDAALGTVSEITVACWMKAISNKYSATILCSGDNTWLLGRYLDSDHLEFSCDGVTISNTMGGSLTGEVDVNDNRWHHVAGVYDGTTMRLYIDGKLDVSSEASGRIIVASSRVLIGENDVATTVYGRERSFHGLIDDVRIYNYAITEAEVVALYAGRKPAERER